MRKHGLTNSEEDSSDHQGPCLQVEEEVGVWEYRAEQEQCSNPDQRTWPHRSLAYMAHLCIVSSLAVEAEIGRLEFSRKVSFLHGMFIGLVWKKFRSRVYLAKAFPVYEACPKGCCVFAG
ncbi:hypothetical protein CDAR_403141 [Caerostris darwini]|uniref:Uncharacterized protein n=1 Tax=Caerostris darwini TaxID=1538125 RepID=A0AAV4X1J3_9ARAC|nr:hypothetical protein CDAR_403141 [Caerostris darwini]